MTAIASPGASRLLRILATLGGIIVIGTVIAALMTPTGEPGPGVARPLHVSGFGERVLVIAPHPDDEVIAPGGLTWEARRAGAQVRVVVVTCGDGFKKAAALRSKGRTDPRAYIALGEARQKECDAALAALGVPREDRVFLGYPDAGMRSLWEFDWDASRPHLARNGSTEVPYSFAYRPGAPYCGDSVARDLEDIIRDYRPTSIVYPDANDRHPDHSASSAFVEYALADLGDACKRYTYLAHFGHYPLPWAYLPTAWMNPPSELRGVGTDWGSLPLTAEAERVKLSGVLQYRSQVRLPHMNVYLRSFVRRNELFGTYTPMRPLRLENDAEPPGSDDAQDLVVIQPGSREVPPLLRRGVAPTGVRMAVGPTTLWIGVTIPGSDAPAVSCAVHLRILGGRATSRLDAKVDPSGAVAVSDLYANSVVPAVTRLRRSGDTTWIGVPADLVEGHSTVLAAGESILPDGSTRGTAWRPVSVR